ncbi:histidine phosphatase family protein [Kitasatospora sp. NPDC051853]|uniref:histidine phosphatase family protein n=1 Tax=Kitasatospora sp. NPDC051853 TaxID=3364058 RepID=UPI0037B4D3BA
MAVEIVYETHSTTTDNEAGIATGWLPGTLSGLGRRQAAELGERRRGGGFAAVLTSDLQRAVETAAIAFPDLLPTRDARLRECDYGALNGTPMAGIAARRLRHLDEPFPGGGQSYRQVTLATAELLAELAVRHDGRRVLLIAHHANRVALDHLLTGAPLAELLTAERTWQPGWHYTLPTNWRP